MSSQLDLLPDCTVASAAMRRFLDEIAARDGRPDRWLPNRLILQNFWVYRYQEYDFADGRLVIKGANQTGKTVALATAIPVVLDGSTRPERFDPDDSRARTLSYFLLGGANEGPAFRYEDRTAYIALEFQHGRRAEFVTIGVGLRASHGIQSIKFWGFVVRDGRRVGRGHEIPLHREQDRRPFTYAELHEALSGDPRNVVVRKSREDYMAAVNHALFGFDELDQYRFLISVLLQLRSPKLAQSQQVGNVEDHLSKSLPELEQTVTRQASKIVSDISTARNVIRKTRDELDVAARLDRSYGYLLNQLAQEEGFDVLQHDRSLRIKDADLARERTRRADAEDRFQAAQAAIADAGAERDRTHATLKTLRELGALERHTELLETETSLGEKRDAVGRATTALSRAEDAVASSRDRVGEVETRWEDEVTALREDLNEALVLAHNALWANAETAFTQALAGVARARLDNREDPVRSLGPEALAGMGNERVHKLGELADRIEAEQLAERSYRNAKHTVDRAAQARARADDDRRAARRSAASAAEGLGDAVREWSSIEGRLTPLDALDLDAVGSAVAGVKTANFEVWDLLAPIRDRAADRRTALNDEKRVFEEDRARLRSEGATLEQQRAEWLVREWAVPALRRGQEDARSRLAAAGVTAEPLYAAIDFPPTMGPDLAASIETALEDAGLLDALVVARRDVGRVPAVLGAGSDRWIEPSRDSGDSAERTLANVLQPASHTLGADDVRAALCALGLDDLAAGAGITRSGGWALGPLRGASARKPEGAQFIGEANRVRERERKLRLIAAEIERLHSQLVQVEGDIGRLDRLLAGLDAELRELAALPEIGALRASLNRAAVAEDLFHNSEIAVLEADKEAERAMAALRETQRARRVVLDEIREARGLDLDGVRALRRATRDIVARATQIGRRGPALRRLRDDHASALHDAAREGERLEQAARDLHAVEAEVRKLEARRDTLRRHISDTGIDVHGVLAEIRDLETRGDELAARIEQSIDARAAARENLRTHEAALDKLATERETIVQSRDAAIEALRMRLDDEPHAQTEAAQALFHGVRDGPVAAAEELLKARTTEGDELLRRIRKQRQEAGTILGKDFSDARPLLVDYHPELLDQQIRFRYHGQRVSPSTLVERLTAVRAEHERILKAKEHELYSEFFLREIAFKLREKIVAAEAVTKQINTLLKQRQIAQNGELLEIDWKPRPSDPDDPESSNYARLVQLLGHADTSVLPEEDTKWVVEFFRRRVDRLTAQDEAGELESVFAEALREALDYRQWYEFRLFTKMPDRPHQRITAEGFGRRSGAGKALVIFLPFLAAAHVQYAAGRKDAPKLIGLDEAFERVDAENMDRMFDVLVSWEFSWVMTGHDLWGMASTLPACTTYEQKLASDVATPILHVWDGTRMRHSLNMEELVAVEAT